MSFCRAVGLGKRESANSVHLTQSASQIGARRWVDRVFEKEKFFSMQTLAFLARSGKQKGSQGEVVLARGVRAT